MVIMTEIDIDNALVKVEKGLRKYCWIQQQLHKKNVSTNREFQKAFNGFYRVRRNAEWQAVYYRIMESGKTSRVNFSQVLAELKERTCRIEASFASKLIATLYPECPVIDKFVLKYFDLSLPHQYERDREKKTVWLYAKLNKKYSDFMSNATARTICENFSKKFPWADITDLKKVDLVLWQTRET